MSIGTLIWHDGTRWGSTGRSTVPYRCTIDVRTHTGPYGVPTGPLEPRRDPTGPRRIPGGTIGPRLIGASLVWAALQIIFVKLKNKSDLGQTWPGTPNQGPGTPNQACRFRNFFLGPIPELFSASCSPHFQEIQKIMSTQLTQHYLLHFQEIQQTMSTKTQTWHSWLRQECQVWVFVDIVC